MELLISKRSFIDKSGEIESIVEPVVRIPYVTGVYETPVGEVRLQVGEFNLNKGVEKVVIFSEALHARKSEHRRVVEFPQRYERVVVHDINATARYEFSRQG